MMRYLFIPTVAAEIVLTEDDESHFSRRGKETTGSDGERSQLDLSRNIKSSR